MRLLTIGLLALTAFAQDPKPEVLELEIKVGKRPGGSYNMPGFQPKPALELDGNKADAATLRASLEKSLDYVLSQQNEEDGHWRFSSREQLRKENGLGRGRGFIRTAGDSMSRSVLTAICCMALRAHQDLAPRRIEYAVEQGLNYVLDNAPNHKKARYGVWTWSFTILFMVDEYHRTKDAKLRERLKEAIQATADKLMGNQHGGMAKAAEAERPEAGRKLPDIDGDDPRNTNKRVSKGGFLGVSPSDDDEIGKIGALISSVSRNGPSGKAGMKAGDRIVQIGDVKIESVDHLYRVADSLEPGSSVKIMVHRAPKVEKQEGGTSSRGRRRRSRRAPDDGGWSYYNTEAMSFATATAVIALIDARELGCEIQQETIDRGVQLVVASRLTKEGSESGYAYRRGARSGPVADLRASIGRIAVCELALYRAGKSNQAYLKDALRIFVKRRGELDRVRGYPGNHFSRSFMNAAYYFLYGHYFSAHTLHTIDDPKLRDGYGMFIQEALLKIQHEQGTWTDHEAWGQLYGTAMALMALGELKHVTPDAYKRPLTTIESKGRRHVEEDEF